MKLRAALFNRLKPSGPIRLREWTSPSHPKAPKTPVGMVIKFARYMGMDSIPVKAVEKLRTDPYFRYCFYEIKYDPAIYDKKSWRWKTTGRRLHDLLKNPDKMTDKDLALGLSRYLDNFVHHMPGGAQGIVLNAITSNELSRNIINAVRNILQEKGLTEKAEELVGTIYSTNYAKQLEFLKLTLEVFQIMVEREGFDPIEIRA